LAVASNTSKLNNSTCGLLKRYQASTLCLAI